MSQQILVVSPHYDDAILSCYSMLAANPGAVVLTVFGGAPAVPTTASWDVECGFSDSDVAVAARRSEDLNALTLCHASQSSLDFLDSQYDPKRPSPTRLAERVAREIDHANPRLLLFPLGGRWHVDHEIAAEACWLALGRSSGLIGVAYLDLPYGLSNRWSAPPDSRELSAGNPLQGMATKADAFACYASQAAPLRDAHKDMLDRALDPATERYWEVSRTPRRPVLTNKLRWLRSRVRQLGGA
ncbi:MAG TPA: PIG-L family deacetylase [Candidatus Dormibacteraeota bacterium]